MILDLGLPGKDGLSVLLTVRQRDPDLPVIILTARDSVEGIVAGLDSGADDYMPKPFKFQELLARVRARLRAPGSHVTYNLRAGDGELDLRTRPVRIDEGEDIELTAREFALAETLFRHAGQILSGEQLLSAVWGLDHEPGTNVVEVTSATSDGNSTTNGSPPSAAWATASKPTPERRTGSDSAGLVDCRRQTLERAVRSVGSDGAEIRECVRHLVK